LDCWELGIIIFLFAFHYQKLANTNGNTKKIFLFVDYNEFYRQNILLLYPLVNTDINTSSVYTEGIIVEKEIIKKS
jgi:hypothetical protein